MATDKSECRALFRDIVVMVMGSALGSSLAYGIGIRIHFAVDGRLVSLEGASAVLGLIVGFTLARMMLPVLRAGAGKPANA